MNSYQRVEAVLNNKIPDRVPVCLLNYICACREAGYTIEECFRDAKKFANSQIKAFKKYGHDMIHLQNGIVGIAQSFGCKIRYFDTTCPVIVETPFKDYEDFINKNSEIKFSELCEILINTTKMIIGEFGDSVYVRPEIGQGPFSLAGLLFGLDKILIDCIDEEKTGLINEVLNICFNTLMEYAKEFKNMGVHVVGIGDSLISPDVVSPEVYEKFGFPYHKRMVYELNKINLSLVIHICGNATPIVSQLVDTGVSAIELDHKINREYCRNVTAGKSTIIGNLDPSGVICNGTPEVISFKAREAIDIFGKDGFYILGSGCDIPYETPEENIFALVGAAKEFGAYE